jgi:signal transduction histidine kinase
MRNWRLPGRVPLRLRVVFRGVFLLLSLATLLLALSVLQDEKERSRRLYAEGLKRTEAQVALRLRNPTGQLALLNPVAAQEPAQPVHPLVLPFAALDFDDRNKARQAVEMSGCALQYPDGSTLCAAVGSNPYAGGFVYLVATLTAGELAVHHNGDLDLGDVHRAVVDVVYRGTVSRWTAPVETSRDGRGRLTGYAGDPPLQKGVRPVRDFRGWLWQEGGCIDPGATAPDCPRRTIVSIRLPVEVFRDQLAARTPVWPPPDLDRLEVRLRVLGPGEDAILFDSDSPGASLPFSLAELRALLRPGETIRVQRLVSHGQPQAPLFTLEGSDAASGPVAPWIARLIHELPPRDSATDPHSDPKKGGAGASDGAKDSGPREQGVIETSLGRFELTVTGDYRSVNRALAAVVTRVAWTVGAMLLAIALAWLAIEIFLIRRIILLTRRAAAASSAIRASGENSGLAELDVVELGGRDELGVLAQGLKDLLLRVNENVQREKIRAQQEKDMWHAVGHEIMAPLQSLMALHAAPGDPSKRYISRMQQAVRVLYGHASPSEAFEATQLAPAPLDIHAFLAHVAANAPYIGIERVEFPGGATATTASEDANDPVRAGTAPTATLVRADEHSLEDVVSHVLRNADRHRRPQTTIRIQLAVDARSVQIMIHNEGEAIAEPLLERIFEYGVSEPAARQADGDADIATDGARRGQGLFVARTYMAKMGGTISARNAADGVEFTLTLPRLQS